MSTPCREFVSGDPSMDSQLSLLRVRSDGSTGTGSVIPVPVPEGSSTPASRTDGDTGVPVLDSAVTVERFSHQKTDDLSLGSVSVVRRRKSTRRCQVCRQDKPWDDYRGGESRTCDECRSKRHCVGCKKRLPDEAFAGIRSKLCLGCLEVRAAKKEERRLARRASWFDDESGRWVRRCSRCKRVLDLESEFYNARTGAETITQRKSYHCKKCANENTHGYESWCRYGPLRETHLARQRVTRARWRENHPERAAENSRRYREKVKLDPVRYAKLRESARVAWRLRHSKEEPLGDEGSGTDEQWKWGKKTPLSGAPMGAYLRRFALRSGAGNIWDDLPVSLHSTYGGVLTRVCERAGISDRAIRRWEQGEGIAAGTADMIITRLGLLWWDIWELPPERVGHGSARDVLAYVGAIERHLAAKTLFEGEEWSG